MISITDIENSNEIDCILNRDFTSFVRTGYVVVGKDNICLPVYYKNFAEKLKKFEVKDDDIFICGHPKTGSTLAQEMIWLIANHLDYKTARNTVIFLRSAVLEYPCLFDLSKMFGQPHGTKETEIWELLINFSSPRVIKTHLHWSLLPEQITKNIKHPKIIVTLRNPEDICVSLYYYSQTHEAYKGTFEDFCKLFLAGRVCFGPFWKQVLSFWDERNRPNIFLLYFKDLIEDLSGTIKKVAKFLEKPIADEQVDELTEHLSFKSMKNNKAVNLEDEKEYVKKIGLCVVENDFVRSGKVGESKTKLSQKLKEEFKAWNEKNISESGIVL